MGPVIAGNDQGTLDQEGGPTPWLAFSLSWIAGLQDLFFFFYPNVRIVVPGNRILELCS